MPGIVTKSKDEVKTADGNNTSDNEIVKEEKLPVATLDDGTKVNISEKVHENKEIDGLVISDIQLTENGNLTQILATVTNSSSEAKGGYRVQLVAYDRDGIEIATIDGYLGDIKAGAKGAFHAEATAVSEFVNANNIQIRKR